MDAQELDEEEDEKPKKAPPKYVVSGGLTGFGVAQDLLHLDFSTPEEAPKEFKAMPFNAKRLTTLKSGLSGVQLRVLLLPHDLDMATEHYVST